jgi:hypothetical protein
VRLLTCANINIRVCGPISALFLHKQTRQIFIIMGDCTEVFDFRGQRLACFDSMFGRRQIALNSRNCMIRVSSNELVVYNSSLEKIMDLRESFVGPLAIDQNDNMYAAKFKSMKILAQDTTVIHHFNFVEGILGDNARSIVLHNSKIYVSFLDRVQVYTLDGIFLFQFSINVQPRCLSTITITDHGDLIVSYGHMNMMQIYEADTGGFIKQIRSNQLSYPSCVAVIHERGSYYTLIVSKNVAGDWSVDLFNYWSKGKPSWNIHPLKLRNNAFSDVHIMCL